MLMPTISLLLLMPMLMKLKSSWETMLSAIILYLMITLMMNPMTDYLMMVTTNNMLDSMSMFMIILSMWISTLMLSTSYYIKTHSHKSFWTSTILLLISLMLAFSTNSTIMFYIWFETSLIPITLIIMLWGNQPERMVASLYIIMYTIIASLPLLTMILKLYKLNFHLNMWMPYHMLPTMFNKHMSLMMLMTAFLVKLPLFSLHLWLPKAHVEAPLAGSMILAAVLLKLGSYGLLRFNKMMIINMNNIIMNIAMSTALIGAIIMNILCLRQTDLKALIAYSSVSHMSLMLIGALSSSKMGQLSAMVIMLTHGLTSSLLFLLTNIMYEKLNSRNIMLMGGSLTLIPTMSLSWLMATSMNMALPPSLNLLGEITIMITSMYISMMMVLLLMVVSLTTAIYSLNMYSLINHNNPQNSTNSMKQMNSSNLMNVTCHTWPLILFTWMPMKLMLWL